MREALDETLSPCSRATLFGCAAFVAGGLLKALNAADPQTVLCYECRACSATHHSCPVGILQQGSLVVASRCADWVRFLELGGLRCIRCGNCTSYCVLHLDMPRIFAEGQHGLVAAMQAGRVPRAALRYAMVNGLVNVEFVDVVAAHLGLAREGGGLR